MINSNSKDGTEVPQSENVEVSMSSQTIAKPNVSRRCICCGFEIKPIHGGGEDKPWQGMWLDGTIDKIAANYGSELDGDMYVVALCDVCVRAKLKDGIIEYAGNYMERSGNGD
jgi:hypothetical protein